MSRRALDLHKDSNDTIQEVFKKLNYDVDQTWTRLSRSLAKSTFMICYILLMFCGTLSISTAAVVFIIKTSNSKQMSDIVDREVLNVGFILNGNASYAQEAMEGFKGKLNDLLLNTGYEANYEQIIGFAESSKEKENLAALNELINKFPEKPDYIIAIGTEVTKVAKKNFLNKIPVIFTAISYPIEDSIVAKYGADQDRGNISGVAYNDPAKNLLSFLRVTFPGKKFGFVYNPKYKQDLSMYKRLDKIAKESDITLSFISTDTTKLSSDQISKADIFFGRYFLVIKLREFLINNEKPFIGNDLLFVRQGALACSVTPPKELGSLAAEKILLPNLMQHISLADIPIVLYKNPITSFNLRAARKYNITIPQAEIAKAKIVIR